MCKPIKDLFFNALPGTGKTDCKDKGFTATLPNFQGSFFSGPSPKKGENRSNIAASVPESGCKSTRLRETGKTNGGLFLKKFPDARRKRLQYSGLKKRQGRRKGRGRGREYTLLYKNGKKTGRRRREITAKRSSYPAMRSPKEWYRPIARRHRNTVQMPVSPPVHTLEYLLYALKSSPKAARQQILPSTVANLRLHEDAPVPADGQTCSRKLADLCTSPFLPTTLNPNRTLDHRFEIWLSFFGFPSPFVLLPTSGLPPRLDVARHAFGKGGGQSAR